MGKSLKGEASKNSWEELKIAERVNGILADPGERVNSSR